MWYNKIYIICFCICYFSIYLFPSSTYKTTVHFRITINCWLVECLIWPHWLPRLTYPLTLYVYLCTCSVAKYVYLYSHAYMTLFRDQPNKVFPIVCWSCQPITSTSPVWYGEASCVFIELLLFWPLWVLLCILLFYYQRVRCEQGKNPSCWWSKSHIVIA